MKPSALPTALALALMCGCHSLLTMNRAQTIALAETEARKLGWKAVEVESASHHGGTWRVLIWRLPKVPGGHGVVEISDDGKVVRFWRGS